MAREYAAILKAWIELNITHPKPTFLGDPEPIE
jgi:vancomycin permeability regulator SanA